MKKIISWVAGSFFRQAGRFLFFIVIGGLIFLLIQHNNIQFKWTDLLGIEMVKADTYQNAYYFNYYKDANLTQQYTALSGGIAAYDTLNKTPNANVQFTDRTWYFSSNPDIRQYAGGRISFPFELLYNQNSEISPDTITQYYCNAWSPLTNGGYYCSDLKNSSSSDYDIIISNPKILVQAIIYYLNSTTGQDGWRTCTLNDNNHAIDCPITNEMQGIKRIRTSTYVQGSSSDTYQVVLGKMVNVYTDGTAQAIQDQTQVITDTNTTSDSNSTATFFNETNTTSESALTSIVSAPISLINNLVVGSHDSICATLNSKQICLPSGDIIWNRTSVGVHDHWFHGGTLEAFISFFNLVVGGFILYKCLLSLFNSVHKLLDPANSWVGVMKL